MVEGGAGLGPWAIQKGELLERGDNRTQNPVIVTLETCWSANLRSNTVEWIRHLHLFYQSNFLSLYYIYMNSMDPSYSGFRIWENQQASKEAGPSVHNRDRSAGPESASSFTVGEIAYVTFFDNFLVCC